MIEGLLWMALANGALLLAAHALLRRIRTENSPLNGVLFVLIHLVLVSGVVLVAGLTGALKPRPLGLSGVVLMTLLLALREHRGIRLPPKPDMGRAGAALAGLIALRLALQVWFLAPSNPDVLAYHLPKVAEWVRAGAFTREMGSDFCAPFPAGFELIETWWTLFLHHDVLIELAGVEFALLAFLAVRLLAQGLGLSARAAWLASTLYVLTPAIALQAVSCLNDAPVAALVLSLAALIAGRAHPALLLLPIGLMGGIKATGLYTLPGWILLAVLLRREPLVRPASLRTVCVIAGAAIAAGLFWYLRNFLWYGSPTYPVKPGPLTFYERLYYIQVGPDLRSLRDNFGALVTDYVADRSEGFSAITFRTSGWGIVPFSIGALAAILEIRRDPGFRLVAAAFGVSLLAVLLMVRSDAWFARFVLFAPALFCIAAARLAESVRPVAWLLALGAALEFIGASLPQDRPVGQVASMMRLGWRERSAAPAQGLQPTADPVGVYATLRSPVYLLYGPDFSRTVVYLRVARPEELEAEMERRGVRVVYVNILRRARYDFDGIVGTGRFRALEGPFFERR